MRSTRIASVVGAWLLLAAGGRTVAAVAEPVAAVAQPVAPTIVVIVTDDQRWDTLWAMPNVRSHLVDQGITFSNAVVSNPLCCPSRASILTGDYSHTTGVWRNMPPFGGFQSFDDSTTIATRLQDAGYRTALLGKYMNGYRHAVPAGYVPPGWDRWFAFIESGFYDYDVSDQGQLRTYGAAPEDYSTDVIASEAVDLIGSTPADDPLFVYLAPFAPHGPATPAPGDEDAFDGLEPWRPPNYNERNVLDKPDWVRSLSLLSARKAAHEDAFRLDQYRSLLAVDEVVGRVVDALDRTGRLGTALIVFTSDNGMGYGEHRWRSKRVAYEESIRVPLVVRADALVTQPRTDTRLVANIDIAPTAAEVAGVPDPQADGISLESLLRHPGGPDPRSDLLLEHYAKPDDRVPSYCGIRTNTFTYVYYSTGEEELYDLVADPYQLANKASARGYASLRREMRERLSILCTPAPPDLTVPW